MKNQLLVENEQLKEIIAIKKFISDYATIPPKEIGYELFSYHRAIVYKGLATLSEQIFDRHYVAMSKEILVKYNAIIPVYIIKKICEKMKN